jgi:translation elongation factor EF-G
MPNNKLKNTIVLKGMASNIVDEAIVVLKPNVKLKVPKTNGAENKVNQRQEFILKEAENVVNEYVNRLKKEEVLRINKSLKRKVIKARIVAVLLGIAFIATLLCK